MVWRQAAVFASTRGTRPEVRGRNSQELRGLDQAAASDGPATSRQATRSRSKNSTARGRRREAANRRAAGAIECRAGRPAVDDVAHQGRARLADRAVSPACLLPPVHGRNQILSEQRPRGHTGQEAAARRLWALAYIERCFEDGKGEVGLDHWEGRRWLGLKRHLILTAVSYLFLARTCAGLRKKKSGVDRLPGEDGDGCDYFGPTTRLGRSRAPVRTSCQAHRLPPTPQRMCSRQPHAQHDPKVAQQGHQVDRPAEMRREYELAL